MTGVGTETPVDLLLAIPRPPTRRPLSDDLAKGTLQANRSFQDNSETTPCPLLHSLTRRTDTTT